MTDAVSQAGALVLGSAPAQSMAMLYQSAAQATSLSMQNAVAQQQQMNTISNTVTAQCLALLLSGGPAARVAPPPQPDSSAVLADALKTLIAALATNQTPPS
ncbi:RebB family R body protein [Skermanella stibiiresistens]|nr:RebB family R body protein [Skermanella stibiiresistens]